MSLPINIDTIKMVIVCEADATADKSGAIGGGLDHGTPDCLTVDGATTDWDLQRVNSPWKYFNDYILFILFLSEIKWI